MTDAVDCRVCGARWAWVRAIGLGNAPCECRPNGAKAGSASAARVPTGALLRNPSLASRSEKFRVATDLMLGRSPGCGMGRAHALFGLDMWLDGERPELLRAAVALWLGAMEEEIEAARKSAAQSAMSCPCGRGDLVAFRLLCDERVRFMCSASSPGCWLSAVERDEALRPAARPPCDSSTPAGGK